MSHLNANILRGGIYHLSWMIEASSALLEQQLSTRKHTISEEKFIGNAGNFFDE
jgi:hypothetical protein